METRRWRKSYNMLITDESGKLVRKESFGSPSGTVKNLLPGNYKISLATTDNFGRTGPVGNEKPLVVPDLSDAVAPKVKKINIH